MATVCVCVKWKNNSLFTSHLSIFIVLPYIINSTHDDDDDDDVKWNHTIVDIDGNSMLCRIGFYQKTLNITNGLRTLRCNLS